MSAKTVDVHPLKPELFLVPSRNGDIALFDIRNSSVSKATDTMRRYHSFTGHSKALSSAFFSPVTGKSIVSVAYDDLVNVYDVPDKGSDYPTLPAHSIRHNNQTGRWLTTFKAVWHPKRENIFFIGSMKQPRQIDVFSKRGKVLGVLTGESLSSVNSIVQCHPNMDVVAGGNSSGRVFVFM